MNSSTTVTAELGIRLVVPEEEAVVPLTAGLHYSAEDPYAIRVSFNVGLDEPVEWTFGRDLLCEGIEGPVGLGDVRVTPSDAPADEFDEEVLNIEIFSPYGQARFEAPVWDVAEFLSRTYLIVPEGAESDHIDMDGELTEILRDAL